MHQPTLITLAVLLLPFSTLITGLDTDSQAGSGSGSGSGSETSSGTSNGNLNPNGNANQNQNQNYNTNENENYNSNTNINNNYNINYNDNDNYNIDVNDDDDDDKKDGVVYTTEIVTALTTYCPKATKFEQNGIVYTITEASTLTITDWFVYLSFLSFPFLSFLSFPSSLPFLRSERASQTHKTQNTNHN